MPKLIFIEHNGTRHAVDANAGDSVMQAALANMVPGILADCGGACSCATCHGYVQPGVFPAPSTMEADMLECVIEPHADSRLTCQLIVTDAMENLEIRLPASQT